MKVTVTSTFFPDKKELETTSETLGDLLAELSRYYKPQGEDDFYDSGKKEVFPDFDILLNGKSYQVIPDGLKTRLQDGDTLGITQFFLMSGG